MMCSNLSPPATALPTPHTRLKSKQQKTARRSRQRLLKDGNCDNNIGNQQFRCYAVNGSGLAGMER